MRSNAYLRRGYVQALLPGNGMLHAHQEILQEVYGTPSLSSLFTVLMSPCTITPAFAKNHKTLKQFNVDTQLSERGKREDPVIQSVRLP
jgi:hypothetical protein